MTDDPAVQPGAAAGPRADLLSASSTGERVATVRHQVRVNELVTIAACLTRPGLLVSRGEPTDVEIATSADNDGTLPRLIPGATTDGEA